MLLEQRLGIQHIQVLPSDIIRIYDVSREPWQINRMLVENGIEVSILDLSVVSLEEHFKKITGGVGIA